MKIIRICWLAPFPVDYLLPEIKVTRNIDIGYGKWLVNLAEAFSKRKDIELHIIMHEAKIPFDQYIFKNNIHFHVLRYSFIIGKGFPSYLPLNVISWYYSIVNKILNKVKEINPDLVHAHGTEGAFS